MTSGTTDRLRTMNYEVAEAIAPTWEKRRAQIEHVSTPVREWLVRELGPSEGDVILELAAGAGDTGFDAAELIGDEGRLISSDLSPAMLGAARRRGAERGIDNVDYRVLDAERIELDDASVDGTVCRFGYMLMADPPAALAETRRVLRPGGRLVLAVWGPPERNPFFAIIGGWLVARGHLPAPQPPPAPGVFSMASAERSRQLLAGAGFDDVGIAEVELRFAVRDVAEYIRFTADTAGPVGLAVRELSGGSLEALTAEIEEALRPFSTGDGYELPGVALCAAAS